jgi:hypothetical protein
LKSSIQGLVSIIAQQNNAESTLANHLLLFQYTLYYI